MATPIATLRNRGLDTMHVYHFRDRAHLALRSMNNAAFHAECCFDSAAQDLIDGGPHAEAAASQWLDLAFRWLESAHASRRQAKADALMAVRGTPIEYWTAERRRGHRIEREAFSRRLEDRFNSGFSESR